jgi:hypothetical protein
MTETHKTRKVTPKDIAEIAIGLASLPENKGKELNQLASAADKFLDHCAALAYKRKISRSDFEAVLVEDTIYTRPATPVWKAFISGDLVAHEAAARELTGLRSTKEAINRLDEFLAEIPSLGIPIPIATQDEVGKMRLGWGDRGITRPLIDIVRPYYDQWWKAKLSESRAESGRKSKKEQI